MIKATRTKYRLGTMRVMKTKRINKKKRKKNPLSTSRAIPSFRRKNKKRTKAPAVATTSGENYK